MKALFRILGGIAVVWIAFMLFCLTMMLTYPDIPGFFDYLKKSEFREISATVTAAKNSRDGDSLLLSLEQDAKLCGEFTLKNACYREAVNHGLPSNLQDSEITITYHPSFLGDGWVYPIAALTIDDQVYLSFDKGYPVVLVDQLAAAVYALLYIGSTVLLIVIGIRIIRGRPFRRKQRESHLLAKLKKAISIL